MMNTEITVDLGTQVLTGKVVNVVGDTITMMEATTKQFFDFPVSMISLKEVTTMMVDKLEMENRYGHLSCFDYPTEYQQMENLNEIIFDVLCKYNENEYSQRANDLYENIKDIATEIINGNINADRLELNYMPINEWVEVYVTEGMCDEAKKLFESMFYFMDTHTRNNWLEGNHLSNFTNTYTNHLMDYILMAHE